VRESEIEVEFSVKRKYDVIGFEGTKKLSQLQVLIYTSM
jgi:hypothetical protein